MRFVADLLRAGALMHEAGFVHRDIKPKNIMVSRSIEDNDDENNENTAGRIQPRRRPRPVIIDYGFAERATPTPTPTTTIRTLGSGIGSDDGTKTNTETTTTTATTNVDLCVVHPGQFKGEVDYVLAEDLANYRGCQRGDAYALGKTMYEFVFGSAELLEPKARMNDAENNNNDDDDEPKISVEAAEARNREFLGLLEQEDGTM
eukprot:jgi/Psemu1/315649/fgenesh1_kg.2307_\